MTDEDLLEARQALRAKVPAIAKRLAPVYAVLQWRWAVTGNYDQFYVPNEIQIADCLHRLITDMDIREDGSASVGSGGFEVYASVDADGGLECEIRFVDEHDCSVSWLDRLQQTPVSTTQRMVDAVARGDGSQHGR